MKTIRQWLQLLPEPFRSQAMRNAERYHSDRYWVLIDEIKFDNQAAGLFSAFSFSKSPEGYEYWERVWIGLTNLQLN